MEFYSRPSAQLVAVNPIVPHGKIWAEEETGRTKRGVGSARWNDLPYWNPNQAAGAYTQTYTTADKTLAGYTPDTEATVYTGAADAEAKLIDLNALRVAYQNLRVFTEDLAQQHNSMLDDLQALGILQ
ncbi:MAG: hypothetical protein M3Q75_05670 [Gemmatimonadota bacterium]|nr:hypothetical protein [Gemmatimonadota bacterium]